MPNAKEHLLISGVASAGAYLLLCHYLGRKPDWGEFLVCETVGLLTGVAPDVVEPAINPNHRGFGHSVALGAGLTKFALAVCSRENADLADFGKIVMAVATVSYGCHLIADGFTPSGLPLLGR